MNAAQFQSRVMMPAMAWVKDWAPALSFDPLAARELLTIAGQESTWTERAQVTNSGAVGPARSFWQGEKTGGMVLVASGGTVAPPIRQMALALCAAASVTPAPDPIWRAIEGHDGLALGLARLLLLTEPKPLPRTEEEGWQSYLWCWRPGAYQRDPAGLRAKWARRWAEASALFPGV